MKKLLIANRGEIAARIIHSAKRLGLETVAVYSSADAEALHTRLADSAVYLGPAAATESYLSIPQILRAAQESGADSVHPGYGFLAENPDFAEACEKAGLIFAGPTSAIMRQAGHKDSARLAAKACKIPVPPGYESKTSDLSEFISAAETLGAPLLVKAAAGGGGRGMRLLESLDGLADILSSASREAEQGFGNGRLLLERYIKNARHIEVQIAGDAHGNFLHFFERDCSLQRRYQKLLEESPARGLSSSVLESLYKAALTLCRHLNVRGLATVEFLVPEQSIPGEPFYFLEINPRVQVEHTVTELRCQIDLIELQLQIAAGLPLPFTQKQIKPSGHAIQCRICAEIPEQNFRPAVGKLKALKIPQEASSFDFHRPAGPGTQLRYDQALTEGLEITPYYDSLILKAICWGETFETSRQGLRQALKDTLIAGPEHNLHFMLSLLDNPVFRQAKQNTAYLDNHWQELIGSLQRLAPLALATHFFRNVENSCPLAFFNSNMSRASELKRNFLLRSQSSLEPERFSLRVLQIKPLLLGISREGEQTEQTVKVERSGAEIQLESNSRIYHPRLTQWELDSQALASSQVYLDGAQFQVYSPQIRAGQAADAEELHIISPLPGKVLRVLAREGDRLKTGDTAIILESMKMEHRLNVRQDCYLKELRVKEGQNVTLGAVLAVLSAKYTALKN